MNPVFEVNKTSRTIFLEILENYSLEQLNKIPEGFSNNIIWNIGHVIAAQQSLVYRLSGLPLHVSDVFIEKYKKGTKPEAAVSETEVTEIKELLSATLMQCHKDYTEGIFTTYQEYTTSMGITLRSVEDALHCNNFHEGLHLGVIMSLRKFV